MRALRVVARSWQSGADAAFFVVTTALLCLGALTWVLGHGPTTPWTVVTAIAWSTATVVGILVSGTTIIAALRRKQAGVDVVALLALIGALAVGEPLAGAVVACMLATGSLLEARAQATARRELSLLSQRAPRTARRRDGDHVTEVDVDDVVRGDVLVVGPGAVVPVDGRLLSAAVLDESALTGEALPVERLAGEDLRSGSLNAGGPLTYVATAVSADSTYARIVHLVEQAQANSAPFVRMADRIAIGFVPFTIAVAGLAWALSGDPVRAVAVLVVATPCPLLLAAPIAIMSGISRAAREGAVVKGGAALEQLARGRVVLFDKTGTLTSGHPVLAAVVTAPRASSITADELLRLAASLDQVSPHVLADAVVTAGRARDLSLEFPADVQERHGYGIEGRVGPHTVRLGKRSWVIDDPDGGTAAPTWVRQVRRRSWLDGSIVVYCGVDGTPAGALLFEDVVRPDAPRMVRALRKAGLERVVLVTGDRADVAEAVGRIVGVDAVHADCDPEAKLAVLANERAHGPTLMVGDGVNDAPALAAADVGVALAARGATASSQAADVVLTVDRIDGLASAVRIARHARRVAVQTVTIGMGLSVVAMLVAAAGYLAPAAGAVLQEGIDVLAIGVALRALIVPGSGQTRLDPAQVALMRRIHGEHRDTSAVVEQVRAVADRLGDDGALAPVQALWQRLRDDLVPHERAEEAELYPMVAQVIGGQDPLGAMSRAHAEIEHQVSRLGRLLDEIGPAAGPGESPENDADARTEADDVTELQRLLYGLYAVLRLHNAQEEESMFSLLPSSGLTGARG